MTDVIDLYWEHSRIPARLKQKLSIQDMKDLAEPLLEHISGLESKLEAAQNLIREQTETINELHEAVERWMARSIKASRGKQINDPDKWR